MLATLSTLFIASSAICVAIGWVLIARGKTDAHMKMMVVAAILAVAFFSIYLSRTIFVGNTAFGGPDSVFPYYTAFLIFHIVLATVGAVLGLVTLYWGYKQQYVKHRKIGPFTSVVWFATAATGITVYLLLYIVYPPGETTNVIRAIIGW
jgi:putative membrane protein